VFVTVICALAAPDGTTASSCFAETNVTLLAASAPRLAAEP
jgi:hypothetical protein